MVTTLRVLQQCLCKPVVIINVSDSQPGHCCTGHTGLYHQFSPSSSSLPHQQLGNTAAENLGSVRARFMQGMVAEPLFQKGNIQTPSPISTEKPVYTEFSDKSIKCFSSKQKTVCNSDVLLTASTLR